MVREVLLVHRKSNSSNRLGHWRSYGLVGVVGGFLTHIRNRRDMHWFTLYSSVFFIHQVLQWNHLHVKVLDNHLDPLLAVPVMLGVSILILRIFNPKAKFHLLSIGLFTLALCLFWEGPWMDNPDLTADVWDVPFYILGAFFFERTINKK